jgi:hypothetical protein
MDYDPLTPERLADLETRVRADFIKVLREEYGRHYAPSGQLLAELWDVVEHHFGPIFDEITLQIIKAGAPPRE